MLIGSRLFVVDINYETEWLSEWYSVDSSTGKFISKKEIFNFTVNWNNDDMFNATYPRQ